MKYVNLIKSILIFGLLSFSFHSIAQSNYDEIGLDWHRSGIIPLRPTMTEFGITSWDIMCDTNRTSYKKIILEAVGGSFDIVHFKYSKVRSRFTTVLENVHLEDGQTITVDFSNLQGCARDIYIKGQSNGSGTLYVWNNLDYGHFTTFELDSSSENGNQTQAQDFTCPDGDSNAVRNFIIVPQLGSANVETVKVFFDNGMIESLDSHSISELNRLQKLTTNFKSTGNYYTRCIKRIEVKASGEQSSNRPVRLEFFKR